ncbi:hypothetical protein EJ08DRAFT_461910 [Tothia fuscella]|uniref:Lysine-specific metallo-endopeptidase domain-containing protein n=1 Tax=Tothia fuscella TaxID=1048955 RepID=A0A9P4NI71_9PEZI|nr:hypothetical protein EJ08DRAFT_461910 [Tothia fuscella]
MLLPLLLVMVAGVAASPDPITIMANLPGSAADYPKLPPDLAKAEPIPSTNEYFWIESACSFDKSVIDRLKFANKAAFYEAAYKDAVDIADQAGQWPQYHTEASDLYFKKGLQDLNEGKFKDEIATNLKRASKWNSKRAWFDDYIVLMCTDWDNKCNRPDADDPNGRNIGRYINHTTSWFWTQSKITCCPPFFTLRDLDEIHDLYKDKPKEEIQNEKMEFFMSSGSAMLHEMMHTTAITQFQEKNGRRNVIDRNMPVGRARVYGPRLVSKVAGDNRELRLTPEETTTNADSYAVFASCNILQTPSYLRTLPSSLQNSDPRKKYICFESHSWPLWQHCNHSRRLSR